MNKACSRCSQEKPAADFYKRSAQCKPCYLKRKNEQNKRPEIAARRNELRRKRLAIPENRERYNDSKRKSRMDPEIRERELEALRKRYRKARRIVFETYGGKCTCCGETEPKFLDLDHINNDGGKERKRLKLNSGSGFYLWVLKNNFPPHLQILCANCNQGKRRNGGACPHIDALDGAPAFT